MCTRINYVLRLVARAETFLQFSTNELSGLNCLLCLAQEWTCFLAILRSYFESLRQFSIIPFHRGRLSRGHYQKTVKLCKTTFRGKSQPLKKKKIRNKKATSFFHFSFFIFFCLFQFPGTFLKGGIRGEAVSQSCQHF